MNDRERIEMRRAIAIITASVLMLLLLIGGLFVMREARADPKELQWTFPTTLVDGTGTVNAADISFSQLRWGRCASGSPFPPPALHRVVEVRRPAGTPNTTPPPNRFTVDFPRGVRWCWEVSIVMFDGLASPWSMAFGEVYFDQPGPAAPEITPVRSPSR